MNSGGKKPESSQSIIALTPVVSHQSRYCVQHPAHWGGHILPAACPISPDQPPNLMQMLYNLRTHFLSELFKRHAYVRVSSIYNMEYVCLDVIGTLLRWACSHSCVGSTMVSLSTHHHL
jgi:hypothetical protein